MKELNELLKTYREKAGYEFAYSVYNKYGILRSALINFERGNNIPNRTEIIALAYIYKLNEKELNELLELRQLEIEKRR